MSNSDKWLFIGQKGEVRSYRLEKILDLILVRSVG